MARRRHPGRDAAERALVQWIKEDATASAADLMQMAQDEGIPLPAPATWRKWVSIARHALGVRFPGRPKGARSARRVRKLSDRHRPKHMAPIDSGSTYLTEEDVRLYLAADLPWEHVDRVAVLVRGINAHLIRRRAKLDGASDRPEVPIDYVEGLGLDSRTERLILSAGVHLARVRRWDQDSLRADVLREAA